MVPNNEKLRFFRFLIGMCGTCINSMLYPISRSFSATRNACGPIPPDPEYVGDMKSMFIHKIYNNYFLSSWINL